MTRSRLCFFLSSASPVARTVHAWSHSRITNHEFRSVQHLCVVSGVRATEVQGHHGPIETVRAFTQIVRLGVCAVARDPVSYLVAVRVPVPVRRLRLLHAATALDVQAVRVYHTLASRRRICLLGRHHLGAWHVLQQTGRLPPTACPDSLPPAPRRAHADSRRRSRQID